MNTVRCFVGVRLAPGIGATLLAACSAIRDADPEWRGEKWVAAENLHLTLKFLGAIGELDIEPLSAAIAQLADASEPFELPFEGVVAVPGTRSCRMLWGSFADPGGRCAALTRAIERAALAFGVAEDERSFAPHVTLCRARRPRRLSVGAFQAAQQATEGAVGFMSVPSASLFSSRLTPRGPIYREIGAWPLGGASPRRAESARGAAG